MKKILFAFIGILIGITAMPQASRAGAQIDPRVIADTADGQTAHFLVVLKSQVDVRAVTAHASNRATQGQLAFSVLRANANATQPAVRAQLDALGVSYQAFYVVNVLAVEGNRAVVDALSARADVAALEPDRAFRVPLESPHLLAPAAPTSIEWNLTKINAPALWSLGYTGQGMVYANADTGVQWDHPALITHYRGWSGVAADHNFNWWDGVRVPVVGGSSCGYAISAPCDDYGHGTHTMGIGVGDDGAGNQIGVAPGAKWIACRNMDRGFGRPSTYISCFNFFLAPTDLNGNNPNPSLRPDVVGNSYGCPPSELCSVNSLQTAMDNLRAAGVFMSVSAGNDGSSCSTISDPPSLYASAITIGATDSNDLIAGFSSRGPITLDGSNRRKPDLVAPGVNVRSSVPGNGYSGMSGTSMAAPHVAGAVALLWSALPQWERFGNTTEYALEQTAVRLTTNQMCGTDVAQQYPNNVYGFGRIDVLAAYNFLVQNPMPFQYYFPQIYK